MSLKINGIYKHFKGNYYLVENTAIDCETGNEMVIYIEHFMEITNYI